MLELVPRGGPESYTHWLWLPEVRDALSPPAPSHSSSLSTLAASSFPLSFWPLVNNVTLLISIPHHYLRSLLSSLSLLLLHGHKVSDRRVETSFPSINTNHTPLSFMKYSPTSRVSSTAVWKTRDNWSEGCTLLEFPPRCVWLLRKERWPLPWKI